MLWFWNSWAVLKSVVALTCGANLIQNINYYTKTASVILNFGPFCSMFPFRAVEAGRYFSGVAHGQAWEGGAAVA